MTITLEPTNSTIRPRRSLPRAHSIRSPRARASSWPRASSPRHTPRPATPIRSIGGRSARRAPGARARSPACRASPTSSTSDSTTAACGGPPTTARPGCRSSTASRPARSARSPSRRRIRTSSTSAPAPGSFARISRSATAIYKSTDGGKTWTHLGLRDSQMIAMIDVDPTNPNRLFVAALGHPYGPNAERGIFRSTDGGQTLSESSIQGRVHERQRRPHRSDRTSNIVYATLWQQQQSFIEGGGFGGAGNGIFKSIDGGTTWKQLTDGLPQVIQANLAIAPSNSRTIYATVAGDFADAGRAGGGRAGRPTSPGRSASTSPPTPASTGRPCSIRAHDAAAGEAAAAAVAACSRIRAARAHRRRRSADDRRRSEERERRLQRVHRVLAHRGRRRHLVGRARRARRRRLSENLGQSQQPEHPPRRLGSGRASSRPIAARRGATGTRSRPPRCITSRPTTRSRIASAADSRTRARRASTAGRTTARSRSTTGIR